MPKGNWNIKEAKTILFCIVSTVKIEEFERIIVNHLKIYFTLLYILLDDTFLLIFVLLTVKICITCVYFGGNFLVFCEDLYKKNYINDNGCVFFLVLELYLKKQCHS